MKRFIISRPILRSPVIICGRISVPSSFQSRCFKQTRGSTLSKSQSNEHASIALAKTVSKLEGGVSYEGGNFDSQTFRGQNPIDAEIIYLQAKVDSIQHQVSLYEEDHVNLQVTLKDNPDSNATSRINAIVSDLLDDLFSLREELACEQCRIDQLKAL